MKSSAKTRKRKSAARTLKENTIIEVSLKQLDTSHLTKLLLETLRRQLGTLSSEQFETNYRKALALKQADPELFPGNPENLQATLELLWADRKNGFCSEQKKSVVFVDPHAPPATGKVPRLRGVYKQLASGMTN